MIPADLHKKIIEHAREMMDHKSKKRPHVLEELIFEVLAAGLPPHDQRAIAYALRGTPEHSEQLLRLVLADQWIERRKAISIDDDAIYTEASGHFRLDVRTIRKACADRTRQGFAAVRQFFQRRSLAYLAIVTRTTTESSVVTSDQSPTQCPLNSDQPMNGV